MDYQKAYWNLVEHHMALLEKYASLREKVYGTSVGKSSDLKIITGEIQEAYWNLVDHYRALLERYASLHKKVYGAGEKRGGAGDVRVSDGDRLN